MTKKQVLSISEQMKIQYKGEFPRENKRQLTTMQELCCLNVRIGSFTLIA